MKQDMYSDRLIKSIKDLKKAWKDVCEAVKDAKITKEQFTQVAEKLLRERQEERDKRLYDIRWKTTRVAAQHSWRGRAGRVRVEGLAHLGVELPGIVQHVARHVRKGIQRFSQLNDVSGLTYLGLRRRTSRLLPKENSKRS